MCHFWIYFWQDSIIKMKKVYKFGTGEEIPEGAKYLYSVKNGVMDKGKGYVDGYQYVWHYFLVEVKE